MSSPSVSVVIPMYNDAGVVAEALASVSSQTHKPDEIIVVDDGSTDDSAGVVNKLDNGITLIAQENAGPAAARNAGIRAASSEWIAFLDADDAWLENRLESQLAILANHPDLQLICGGICRYEDPVPDQPDDPAEIKPLSLESFVYGNPVATSTVLVRKSALEKVGCFDEQFRGPEDYDLWMRLAVEHRLAYLGRIVSRYRFTPGSLSLSPETFLPQVLGVIDKAFADGGVLAARPEKHVMQSRQYMACAWMASQRNDKRLAWRYFFNSVGISPFGQVVKGRRWARLKLFRMLIRKHGLF